MSRETKKNIWFVYSNDHWGTSSIGSIKDLFTMNDLRLIV